MAIINNQTNKKSILSSTDDYMLPHIVFNSCNEVIIEGSKGILEYNTEKIRLNAGICILDFSGMELCIRNLSLDEIVIAGHIDTFRFCRV